MVKEEEIMAEAGGGRGGYMDLLGLGEDDYLLCLSPSSYFTSSVVSATTTSTTAAASLPTSTSYLDLAPAYHHMLSFAGQEQYHGDGVLGFQCYGGDHAIPAAVPQKSSPTTECSSSISSMSSSPPATAISAVSCSKPQAFKVRSQPALAAIVAGPVLQLMFRLFQLVSAYSLSQNTIESAEISRLFHQLNQPATGCKPDWLSP
jgi:hypothetical protein